MRRPAWSRARSRAILQPQDVGGLRQMGQQRIVAEMFPMMRIEAAKRPRHGGAGTHHRAVDVDRQARDNSS